MRKRCCEVLFVYTHIEHGVDELFVVEKFSKWPHHNEEKHRKPLEKSSKKGEGLEQAPIVHFYHRHGLQVEVDLYFQEIRVQWILDITLLVEEDLVQYICLNVLQIEGVGFNFVDPWQSTEVPGFNQT
jgi:hypothetical protein